MIAILNVALAGLMVPAGPGGGDIVLRHDVPPKYNRTDYESVCGSTLFRVRFGNGPGGRVHRVWVEGRPVAGAAEQLDVRAARRVISRIGIMNCGPDPGRPLFRGVMELSAIESQRLGMQPTIYFRVSRRGREGWRLSID